MKKIYTHSVCDSPDPTPRGRRPNQQESTTSKSRTFSLGPIRYRRMAEQIAAAIRDSIANGQLFPGTHLLEAEIAREMQTSRIPVREALVQLEQEGFVVRQAGRGTFVTELTEKMMREVSIFRGLLEGYAASQAAKRLTAADLTHLDGLVKEMFVAARAGDFSGFIQCDYRFHEYIIHAGGHDLLEEVWKTTHAKIRVYLAATNLMQAELKSIAQGHARALEALRAGDPERAKKAMETHTDVSLKLLLAKLQNDTRTVGRPWDRKQQTDGPELHISRRSL